jgi:3'(2'), 5'-bisphosphate nucleotidase
LFKIPPYWETQLQQIARMAGDVIMSLRTSDLEIARKEDNSQVTKADIAANELICVQLKQLTADIEIVSEEGQQNPQQSSFWCVDPLDGTKGYIKGGSEFTVNIALVHDGLPILGVIYIPPSNELYYGEVDKYAYSIKDDKRTNLQVRKPPASGNTLILSHYHRNQRQEEICKQFNGTEVMIASSSLKFCRIAEGIADIYPRFGSTMEWDTAAGHAILKAAGGRVQLMSDFNSELAYGKPNFLNPHFVVFGG